MELCGTEEEYLLVDGPVVHAEYLLHVVHLISEDGGYHIINLKTEKETTQSQSCTHTEGRFTCWTHTELYLLHVQRPDRRDVTDARFTDHRLGKLHLSCDVGHLHRVVVVVGDTESVLEENQRGKSSLVFTIKFKV